MSTQVITDRLLHSPSRIDLTCFQGQKIRGDFSHPRTKGREERDSLSERDEVLRGQTHEDDHDELRMTRGRKRETKNDVSCMEASSFQSLKNPEFQFSDTLTWCLPMNDLTSCSAMSSSSKTNDLKSQAWAWKQLKHVLPTFDILIPSSQYVRKSKNMP